MTKEKATRHNLAIVIPAYKAQFFSKALNAIANQSCKDFTLYIGDDASPENLKAIADNYADKIHLVYHRFETNLGGSDLVSHWHRCIDLTKDEEWIWLFSDDDEMDVNCVEAFYNTLNENPNFDLFRFDLKIIDQDSIQSESDIDTRNVLPDIITTEHLLVERLKGAFFLTVIEYIFRKEKYLEVDKFQQFDLAYCSDDATWLKIGTQKGICRVKDVNVYWRASLTNISTVKNKTTKYRQTLAGLEYAKWLITFCGKHLPGITNSELNTLLFNWYKNAFYSAFLEISNYKLTKGLIKIRKLTQTNWLRFLQAWIKLLKERNYHQLKSVLK